MFTTRQSCTLPGRWLSSTAEASQASYFCDLHMHRASLAGANQSGTSCRSTTTTAVQVNVATVHAIAAHMVQGYRDWSEGSALRV